MRVPGRSAATARIYSDPIRRFADLDFVFWRRKVQKSSSDLRFLLAYRWFDVIPVERFRIGWGAAMLIETTHETTPSPQTNPKPTSSLGRFRDVRLDKRGLSFSMRSSRANPCACENWRAAAALPSSGTVISWPTKRCRSNG
jgi:hypothetical protein